MGLGMGLISNDGTAEGEGGWEWGEEDWRPAIGEFVLGFLVMR